MRIYTSYYANLRNLAMDIIPISIAGRAPDWYYGLEYKKLAPKRYFFNIWKENGDNDYYIRHFKKEVLDLLDARQVVSDLIKLSGGKDIALLCYETPDKFCHRHLVADWLTENDYYVDEFKNKPITNTLFSFVREER